jgi:hypothetical protein
MLEEEWASHARRRARLVEVALLLYVGRLKGSKIGLSATALGHSSYQESGLPHSLSGGKNTC